jgi:hypothetical protein
MIRPSHSALLLLVLFGFGCASTPAMAPFAAEREPRIIAIRNGSGRPAQTILLQDAHERADQPRRVGGISPAAAGMLYTFLRPKNSAPLPATVRVVFSFPREPQQSKVVDLSEIAKKATGTPNEALVFELRPDQTVEVSLEQVQP